MATLRKVSSVTFLGLLLILVQWTLGAAAPQNAATIVKAVPKDCVADSPGSPIHNITSKDLVEGGNLVIKGNACIGSLCGDADATFPVLRLKATDVNILFDDQEVPEGGSGSSRKWAIRINPLDPVQSTNLDQMSVRDVDNGTDPFTVAGGAPNSSLFIAGTGRVGIGTASPSQNLHVFGSDGFTGVLVQETNATTTSRRMLELKNNGASRLDLTDTSTGFTWGINDNFGDLRLNRSLTNGTVAFDLQPYGNLTIAGTLTQNSDRYTKRDLLPVRGDEVLAKLAALPISTWSLKTDDPKVRHLGPMAQDFAAAFGLGEDDRHIAPLDVAGVSLVAIQTLKAEKDAEIAQLQRENAELTERLTALEALVSAMLAQKD